MKISKKVVESFVNAQTIGDLRKVYVKNMKKYNAPFYTNQLSALYEERFEEVKELRRSLKGKVYRKPTEETVDFFLNAVNIVKGLDGVECEVNGDWAWFTGETKKNRKALKDAGCMYSVKRQAWYIA